MSLVFSLWSRKSRPLAFYASSILANLAILFGNVRLLNFSFLFTGLKSQFRENRRLPATKVIFIRRCKRTDGSSDPCRLAGRTCFLVRKKIGDILLSVDVKERKGLRTHGDFPVPTPPPGGMPDFRRGPQSRSLKDG